MGAPGRAPARAVSGPLKGWGPPADQSGQPAARAASPEANVARAGIPERPAPRALPPGSLALARRCFQTCCAWIWGAGGRPGSPGTRAAGGRERGRRECARAARGSAGGRGAEARARSLPPPIPGKGACPRRAPARGRKRGFAALGITPLCSGPRDGRGRSQVGGPCLAHRLWPLSGLGGRVREMGARGRLWGLFRPRPSALSRTSDALGPQRARPAAFRARSVPASRVRRQLGACGRAASGPGRRRPRRGRTSGRVQATSLGILAPWPALLARASTSGAGPGGESAPRGRLQLRPGRRAPGCGGGGGGGRRAAPSGRERAPAPPAACPPLPSRPRPGRPPHPRSTAAPASRRALGSLVRARAQSAASPHSPCPRARCTGVRSAFGYLCATRARACPAGKLVACVGRHADCHTCVRAQSRSVSMRARDGRIESNHVLPAAGPVVVCKRWPPSNLNPESWLA